MQLAARKRYQALIFGICYLLNYSSDVRSYYVYEAKECTNINGEVSLFNCNNLQYSVAICAGIGFLFWGNIYDNFDKPRLVTTGLLIILAVLSLTEAVFTGPRDITVKDETVIATLYQVKSVFTSGILLVCIIILHNWF